MARKSGGPRVPLSLGIASKSPTRRYASAGLANVTPHTASALAGSPLAQPEPDATSARTVAGLASAALTAKSVTSVASALAAAQIESSKQALKSSQEIFSAAHAARLAASIPAATSALEVASAFAAAQFGNAQTATKVPTELTSAFEAVRKVTAAIYANRAPASHSPLAAIAPSAAQEPVPIPAPEFKEYLVKRDNERPFSFAGNRLAMASVESTLGLETTTATIYKTRGGKFIAAISRSERHSVFEVGLGVSNFIDDDEPVHTKKRTGYRRAEVFESLDAALGWFKPGRLTDQLRKELGLDEPIRID